MEHKVKAYKRRGKDGKMVMVKAHTRKSKDSMSFTQEGAGKELKQRRQRRILTDEAIHAFNRKYFGYELTPYMITVAKKLYNGGTPKRSAIHRAYYRGVFRENDKASSITDSELNRQQEYLAWKDKRNYYKHNR